LIRTEIKYDETWYTETNLLREPIKSDSINKKNQMCCCRPNNMHLESDKF